MRRCGLSVALQLAGRALLYLAGAVAVAVWIIAQARCGSAPPDQKRIGCAFDNLGRWNYGRPRYIYLGRRGNTARDGITATDRQSATSSLSSTSALRARD